MSDRAGQWGGKAFGVATGVPGGIGFALLANSNRVCTTPTGVTEVWADPTSAVPLNCVLVWGSDFTQLGPWIAGAVVGLLGLLFGSIYDSWKGGKK